MKYQLVSKVPYPLCMNLPGGKSLHLGAREKSAPMEEAELQSFEVKKFIDKGMVLLVHIAEPVAAKAK